MVKVRCRLKITWSVGAFGVCMALVELVVSAIGNVCALDDVTTEPSLALALVGAWNYRVRAIVMVMVMARLTVTWSVGAFGVCMTLVH